MGNPKVAHNPTSVVKDSEIIRGSHWVKLIKMKQAGTFIKKKKQASTIEDKEKFKQFLGCSILFIERLKIYMMNCGQTISILTNSAH